MKLMTKIKKRIKSKTYLLNHVVAMIGILEVNLHLLRNSLGNHYGYAFIGVAIAGYIVRELTKGAVDDK